MNLLRNIGWVLFGLFNFALVVIFACPSNEGPIWPSLAALAILGAEYAAPKLYRRWQKRPRRRRFYHGTGDSYTLSFRRG